MDQVATASKPQGVSTPEVERDEKGRWLAGKGSPHPGREGLQNKLTKAGLQHAIATFEPHLELSVSVMVGHLERCKRRLEVAEELDNKVGDMMALLDGGQVTDALEAEGRMDELTNAVRALRDWLTEALECRTCPKYIEIILGYVFGKPRQTVDIPAVEGTLVALLQRAREVADEQRREAEADARTTIDVQPVRKRPARKAKAAAKPKKHR